TQAHESKQHEPAVQLPVRDLGEACPLGSRVNDRRVERNGGGSSSKSRSVGRGVAPGGRRGGGAGGLGVGAVRVHDHADQPVPVPQLHQRQRVGAAVLVLLAARQRRADQPAVPLRRAQRRLLVPRRCHRRQDARAPAPPGVQRQDPAGDADGPVPDVRRRVDPGGGEPGAGICGCYCLRHLGRVTILAPLALLPTALGIQTFDIQDLWCHCSALVEHCRV
ncbi:Lipid transfer protein, partial [Zea mays]